MTYPDLSQAMFGIAYDQAWHALNDKTITPARRIEEAVDAIVRYGDNLDTLAMVKS